MEEQENPPLVDKTVTFDLKRQTAELILAIIIGVLLCVVGYLLGNNFSLKDLFMTHEESSEIEKTAPASTDEWGGMPTLSPSTATGTFVGTPEERIGLPPNSDYLIQYDRIYYQGKMIADLDFETAQYIDAGFIKDNKRVFQNGELIVGADPERCTKEQVDQCSESLRWQSLYAPYVLEVAWNNEPVNAEEIIPAATCRHGGYVVGKVNNGVLAGGDVLLQNGSECDMWCSASTPPAATEHFVRFNNYLIPVTAKTGFSFADARVKLGETSSETSGEEESESPVIDIPNSNYWLTNPQTIGFSSEGSNDEVEYLFTDPLAGSIYRSKKDCFISKRPDHVKVSYRLDFDYINKSTGVLDLKMLDGTKNSEAYQYIQSYHSCHELVEEGWLKPNERLVKTGELPNGDEVYRLVNPQDEHLIEKYEDKNTLASFNGGENKYTYDEYLSFNPYLYWQDPFGGWVQFMNRRFESAAEKCKPVVYLYPRKTGNFSVYVEPNGGFTKTIPEYGTGWHVTATPESLITDKKTGETYPYLYWSGVNTNIPKITEGWVVKNENIETFLIEKLSKLGLNEKEINDFNEYWIDRFETEGADQYKIMFLPQQQFEVLAPLTVEGDEVPESTIRVMMYAQPAEVGDTLPEQILPPTPARNGFTVIEWGGALLN